MREVSPEQHRIDTASSLEVVGNAGPGQRCTAYVGLDVY